MDMRTVILRRLGGRRPSPSIVISLIALFIALSGTAVAAKVLITSSAQIKAGAVNGGDIADRSIAGRDLKGNAVTGDKVKSGSIPLGDLDVAARDAISDAGAQALEAFRLTGPSDVEPSKEATVATLKDIPPGVYAIFAKTVLTAKAPTSGVFKQGETVSGHCKLDASGDTDQARALLGTPGSASPGEVLTQITRTFASTGTVVLSCDVQPATWSATDSSIIAVHVAKAPRQAVDG